MPHEGGGISNEEGTILGESKEKIEGAQDANETFHVVIATGNCEYGAIGLCASR
jgi:hypothetical protein